MLISLYTHPSMQSQSVLQSNNNMAMRFGKSQQLSLCDAFLSSFCSVVCAECLYTKVFFFALVIRTLFSAFLLHSSSCALSQ